MNARDALEVVRRLTGGYKDREHALASGDVPIALAVLTALVERAGEPRKPRLEASQERTYDLRTYRSRP